MYKVLSKYPPPSFSMAESAIQCCQVSSEFSGQISKKILPNPEKFCIFVFVLYRYVGDWEGNII